jgi:hypothetical protein
MDNNDFNKKLKSYLTVYKVPIAPDSLDPTVFYFPETGELPRLLPGVQAQITNAIEMLVSGQPSRVVRYVIVGDAVSPGTKKRDTDIKVIVQLNKAIMDVDVDGLLAEDVLKLCDTLSNKIAIGTMRKIRYIPTIRDIDVADYSAIYDVPTSSWLKVPSGLKQ